MCALHILMCVGCSVLLINSVQYAGCRVHCALSVLGVQSMLWRVKCVGYRLQIDVSSVLCASCSVQFPVLSVQSTLCSVKYAAWCVHCSACSVQYSGHYLAWRVVGRKSFRLELFPSGHIVQWGKGSTIQRPAAWFILSRQAMSYKYMEKCLLFTV